MPERVGFDNSDADVVPSKFCRWFDDERPLQRSAGIESSLVASTGDEHGSGGIHLCVAKWLLSLMT